MGNQLPTKRTKIRHHFTACVDVPSPPAVTVDGELLLLLILGQVPYSAIRQHIPEFLVFLLPTLVNIWSGCRRVSLSPKLPELLRSHPSVAKKSDTFSLVSYLHVLVPSLVTAFLQFLKSTPRLLMTMDSNESSSSGKRRRQEAGPAVSFKIVCGQL